MQSGLSDISEKKHQGDASICRQHDKNQQLPKEFKNHTTFMSSILLEHYSNHVYKFCVQMELTHFWNLLFKLLPQDMLALFV